MDSSIKATRAMNEIVKRYPSETASLFTGVGIKARPTGKNLVIALKRGHVTPRQLFHKTLGSSYDDFNSGDIKMIAGVGAPAGPTAAKEAGASKFENILNGLLSTASQAADIYGKFKNPGTPGAAIQEPQPMNQPAGKAMPWGLIAAGAGVVIVLVVVLVMLKKK